MKRTIVKSALWEVLAFILQTLIMWWWLGSLPSSLKLNLVLTFIKVILLSGYLSLWKKTGWLK